MINEPTYQGYVSTFVISPSTPLSVSASGAILGYISEVGTYSFTVTAYNAASDMNATIRFIVSPKSCTGVNGISVASGKRVLYYCPEYYTGNAYRLCTNGVLSAIQYDECTMIPPSGFSYSTNEIIVSLYSSFSSGYPTVNSTVTSYSIAPEAPEGVEFDSITGNLLGVPATTNVTVFTITASNTAGSATFELTLRVVGLTCPAMKDIPETPAGESYSYDCTTLEGYKGVSTRTCVLSADQKSAQWSTPIAFCVEKKWKFTTPDYIGIIVCIFCSIIFGWALLMKTENKHMNILPVSKLPQVPAPIPYEVDDIQSSSPGSDLSDAASQTLPELETVSVASEVQSVEPSP